MKSAGLNQECGAESREREEERIKSTGGEEGASNQENRGAESRVRGGWIVSAGLNQEWAAKYGAE